MDRGLSLKRRVFDFRNKRMVVTVAIIALLLSLLALIGAYQWSLAPIDPGSSDKVRVVVEPGETVVDIANKLKTQDLIRSETSFRIYAELTDTKDRLQAGAYALSKNLSVADIIDHMSTGKTDELNVSIAPGLTLKQQYDIEIEGSLAWQGYQKDEIDTAFAATYDSWLLEERPKGASLEGYLYPETFRVSAGDDLSVVVERSLEEFERLIVENDIRAKLKQHDLTLHQGITLASIIQKEVSDSADQRQVSQVFLKRLAKNMPLQSDPTFIYPARQAGQTPHSDFESPYNTYKHRGLPPGPISNFNFSALEAVVDPAAGEYLFFVADKDGVTHFSLTLEEHEIKVDRFCTDHCTDF